MKQEIDGPQAEDLKSVFCGQMCAYMLGHSVESNSWNIATSWTIAPPDSSVHESFQAIVLECVAISGSRGSSRHRN